MEKKFAGLIPPNAKTVLEIINEDFIGVESSNIKEYFLRINPTCNYTIENIENIFGNVSDKFDVIVFNSSAFATLSVRKLTILTDKVAEYLKDDGLMIFLLENVSYADNITSLLNGKSPKVKSILNLEDLQNAIHSSKVTLTKTLHTIKDIVVNQALVEMSGTKLNITHYIVCAIKNKAAESLKNTLIQSYLGEVLVCASVRVNEANKFMATKPGVYISAAKSGEPLILSSDGKYNNKVLINQRVSIDNVDMGVNLFESVASRNYLLIEEMDDNPILWRRKYEENQFINFIGVHGVQTSTKTLAELFKQFNPHVRIFENQLKELPPHRDFAGELAKKKPITIFFGALNRDNDFYEVLPAINKIAAEYGDNILFKVIAKTELFNKIEATNKVFVGKREVYNGQYVPYEVYEQELRTTDISLLPLRDNIFNRSKSDLKFIECAGNGSVALASPTVYANTIKDGETGFIYHDVNDFYNKLKLLIKDNNKRLEVAENAYNYVKHNRLLSQHYEERWDWYNELITRLPELNAEVRKRIEILKEKGYEAFGGFGDVDEKIDVFNN